MTTATFDFHLLLHSASLVEDELRKRLARMNIRPRQARMIDALAHMEPASQVALARAFGITPSSMSTMTARLIDGGYITREVDPNETRSNILRLTDRGRDLLADIHAAWGDIDAMIVDRLGAGRAASLSEVTRDLRDSLGGRAPGRDARTTPSNRLEAKT